MQKILFYFSLLIFTFLSSCEDTVNIPLQNSTPKLVIDANLKWQKGTTGEEQTIKLSLTNDFYSNSIVPAKGATVIVKNSANTIFTFTEVANTEDYVCTNFVPVINENYTLEVLYQGQKYTATSTLIATPVIENIEQETVPGFGGEDQIQIKFFFQDNGSEDNFYLVGAKNPRIQTPEYGAITDEFFQGNKMFGFYNNEKIDRGSTIRFTLQGMNNSYYNFMNKLIAISGLNAGNPFATAPAILRGNIKNQTNPEVFPLGYFSLGETDTRDYVVQ